MSYVIDVILLADTGTLEGDTGLLHDVNRYFGLSAGLQLVPRALGGGNKAPQYNMAVGSFTAGIFGDTADFVAHCRRLDWAAAGADRVQLLVQEEVNSGFGMTQIYADPNTDPAFEFPPAAAEPEVMAVIFGRDADPVSVTMGSRPAMTKLFEGLSVNWSEVYLAKIEQGPRDVLEHERGLMNGESGR